MSWRSYMDPAVCLGGAAECFSPLCMMLQDTLEAAARQALTLRLQESLKLAHASAASKMDELLATQRELQVSAAAL